MENIKGRILFIGAEDDVLWDTCKYIRRMDALLKAMPHDSQYELALYPHDPILSFRKGCSGRCCRLDLD